MKTDFHHKARVSLTIEVTGNNSFIVSSPDVAGLFLYGKTLKDALKNLPLVLGIMSYLNEGTKIWRYLLSKDEIAKWRPHKQDTDKMRRRARKLMVDGDPDIIIELSQAIDAAKKAGDKKAADLMSRAHQSIAILESTKIRRERINKNLPKRLKR